MERIILVSTPWPLYNRPSIQLGALKAYLKQEIAGLEVHAFHAYLKVAETIGYRLYRTISERTWLAETIYAALLHPERFEKIKKIFDREIRGKSELRGVNFEELATQVKDTSENLIHRTNWGAYGLAGFSICLCQLTSALYFIKRVKQSFPQLPVVVGGSMFAGDSTCQLLKVFPEINFVVNGEGERPLSKLITHLMADRGPEDLPLIPGLIARDHNDDAIPLTFSQIEALSSVPPPDFDDYFHLLNTFNSQQSFFPTLPAEISRGCWWRRPDGHGTSAGCAFCNLNQQWDGYRSKSAKQVVSEIDYLTTKYRTLSVAFMDNLIPAQASKEIFEQLAQMDRDFRFFGEIRASTPRQTLKAMRGAGVEEVQIGIEALSTRLLKKLNKGTTAVRNLEIMRDCEGLGISNVSNLIVHFPTSDRQDVEETLRALEFALPFRPLRSVHFWLGLGSPVWQHHAAFGLKAVFNHPYYAALFPQDVVRSIRFMIQAYRGDLRHQRSLWQPVKEKVRAWKKSYEAIRMRHGCGPILSFRDGGDFLMIREKRSKGEPLTHRLTGTSRAIYLHCQEHSPLKRILAQFSGLPEDKIVAFLKMMVDKKLMFQEDEYYLSLAVPVRA